MQLVLYAFAVLVALATAPSAVRGDRCANIELGQIDYEKMIEFSPFFVYVSTVGPYNCTQVMYVGTAAGNTSYSGTSIVIRGKDVFTYDITLKDSVFSAFQCSDAAPSSYRVLFSRLNNSKEASFCVFFCDESGDNIAMLACPGKTESDFLYIKKYIAENLKVNITGPVYDSQSVCPKPKICAAFT